MIIKKKKKLEIIPGVRELLTKCIIVAGEDQLSKQANENATLLFQCLVRSTLCTKLVAENYRLSSEAFEWLVGEIENRFVQAQVRKSGRCDIVLELSCVLLFTYHIGHFL